MVRIYMVLFQKGGYLPSHPKLHTTPDSQVNCETEIQVVVSPANQSS